MKIEEKKAMEIEFYQKLFLVTHNEFVYSVVSNERQSSLANFSKKIA